MCTSCISYIFFYDNLRIINTYKEDFSSKDDPLIDTGKYIISPEIPQKKCPENFFNIFTIFIDISIIFTSIKINSNGKTTTDYFLQHRRIY